MPPMPPSLRLKPKEEGSTWIERLKSLKKKDLAALGVCLLMLGVLPAAQHIIAPSGDNGGQLEQGFATPGGDNGGSANAGYEDGVGVANRGGLVGESGGEVITPLTGRDPTSFILGLNGAGSGGGTGSAAGAGAGGATPTGLKDSLAQMMQRSLPAATQAAALPTPNAHLTTTLGSIMSSFGGGAASAAGVVGLKPDTSMLNAAKAAPSHPAPAGASYGAGPAPGYAGVSKRGLTDILGDAERQKAMADNAAEKFNHEGAEQALREAAAASPAIAGGAGGLGGAGQGVSGPTATPANATGSNQSKSFGQSLAQQEAMAEFQKQLDWCWKKQEAASGELLGPAVSGGSLFGSIPDCSNIPDYVMSDWWKTLNKSISDLMLSPLTGLSDSLSKKIKDSIDKAINPDKEEPCIIYTLTAGGQASEPQRAPIPDSEQTSDDSSGGGADAGGGSAPAPKKQKDTFFHAQCNGTVPMWKNSSEQGVDFVQIPGSDGKGCTPEPQCSDADTAHGVGKGGSNPGAHGSPATNTVQSNAKIMVMRQQAGVAEPAANTADHDCWQRENDFVNAFQKGLQFQQAAAGITANAANQMRQVLTGPIASYAHEVCSQFYNQLGKDAGGAQSACGTKNATAGAVTNFGSSSGSGSSSSSAAASCAPPQIDPAEETGCESSAQGGVATGNMNQSLGNMTTTKQVEAFIQTYSPKYAAPQHTLSGIIAYSYPSATAMQQGQKASDLYTQYMAPANSVENQQAGSHAEACRQATGSVYQVKDDPNCSGTAFTEAPTQDDVNKLGKACSASGPTTVASK